MEKKSDLETLKENYEEFREKYQLAEFEELNADFNIEKISSAETDFLVREIRKFIADKFSGYLRFIENLLNPIDGSMFIFTIIKTLGQEEKKKLSEIYKRLAQSEIKIIELDIDFQEEKEAEFIRESHLIWKNIKKDLLEIIKVVKNNWDVKIESNGKNYFG